MRIIVKQVPCQVSVPIHHHTRRSPIKRPPESPFPALLRRSSEIPQPGVPAKNKKTSWRKAGRLNLKRTSGAGQVDEEQTRKRVASRPRSRRKAMHQILNVMPPV